MEKVWLKSYPPGVPAEINPDANQSLAEVIENSCTKFAKRTAFINFGVNISYEQLENYSRDVAAYLQNVLKIKKNDRVAIMMPNCLQYPICLYAILRIGAIVVNVNPLYTSDELVHQMNDSSTETIIVISNFAKTVQDSLSRIPSMKNVIVTELGDLFPKIKSALIYIVLHYIQKRIPAWHIQDVISFKQVVKQGKKFQLKPVEVNNTDIAFLQYTGGTTGVSKGAMLTHRNIIANLQQADAWFKSLLADREEMIVTALPLYHIFSLTANCFFFCKIGGTNLLITNPRDVPHALKTIAKYQVTAITGVNTLFNAWLKSPLFNKLNLNQLHLTLGGGMAVQRAVADRWQEVTGKPLLEAYGLTEASPCVTINPPSLKSFNGTIGLPVSSTDVTILDNNGLEVPIGEPGELAVKGPQVMKGYWKNPEETAKVFNKDGWLLTGDIAKIDQEGYVRLLERKKDMILVSGFNVYPNEIEDVIVKLPGVKEAAVVGIVDNSSGEVPKAFIVKDDPNLTADEIIRFARKHLTAYKVPKYIVFVDELPKTYVGKILRRALRR